MADQRSRRRRWTSWFVPSAEGHAHGHAAGHDRLHGSSHGRTVPRDDAVTAEVPVVAPVVPAPAAPASSWSSPGTDGRDTVEPQVDAGRFTLQGRIGAGNHGVVFRAVDRHLGRQVAIKRFSHFLADDPRAMRRITREVETLARVSHPNVVTVHDLVRMPDGDGEVVPHLVMELVEGTSLRDLLAQRGPSPRSVVVVLGVLDGLAACHRAGILHLDIKPANVLVTPAGGIKIVDFGIARAASDATATVAGTPHYMAPEQYDGRADERSDVYSVGCLLFECLTGRAPFEGTMATQLMAHRTQARPDPRASAPWVGASLAAVVQKAMAIDPADRYAGVGAMAEALSAAVADVDTDAAARPVAQPAAVLPTGPAPRPTAEPVAEPMIRPLSRPGELGDRRRPPEHVAEPAPEALGHAGPSVTRWTRLVSLLLGLAASAAVLAVVPMVAWASLDLAPSSTRPRAMDDLSADAWWMISVGIALVLLVLRRKRFFPRLAGPPVGAPLPDGPLAPSARSGIAMAFGASVKGSLPLLLPWYVLGLLAVLTASGLGAPDDPYADVWTTLWVLAPLVALVLGVRSVTGMRMRLGAITLSFLCLMIAAGAAVYFVLAATFVV
ncbi:serine/threonine-protein kinase [Aeromicrobium sp. 50.2.37]|uniref:serine/threonine-protein kinase n=1 Tax=Aeromicrobium sp. 50.2.37 TaxID=2969305 RepID=UPI00215006D7|nr:serine/threonine-protein kinase [Aeromicrobium sp. 50.2.37]MCR4511782.1 protein kinase [Aeromicrobium sp. 50.2.37]